VPICGDGFIDAPEECEGPGTATYSDTCELVEACTNATDDDGDGLIDCLDPDCPPCVVPKKDPATIKFGRLPGTDRFKAHGSLQSSDETLTFDPATDTVTVMLSNANGIILRSTMGPGTMTSRAPGKADFKDRSLTVADGLYRFKISVRKGLWVFSILARGDYSAATEQQMTLSINVGPQSFALSRNWAKKNYGWYLGFDRVK
jgi:hypothetical protein